MLLSEFILCLGRWHIGPGPGSQMSGATRGSRVGPRQSETVLFKIFVYFVVSCELHRSIDLRVVRRCQSSVASMWTSSCGRRVSVFSVSWTLPSTCVSSGSARCPSLRCGQSCGRRDVTVTTYFP